MHTKMEKGAGMVALHWRRIFVPVGHTRKRGKMLKVLKEDVKIRLKIRVMAKSRELFRFADS